MTTNLYAQVDVAKWGWDIAIFLWLVGISGMSTLAYYWVRRAPVAYVALATVLLGLIVVFSHLTRWWNLPVAVFYALINFSFNWGSWMMLGIALLSAQALICLLLAIDQYRPAERFPKLATMPVVAPLLKWLPAITRSNAVLALFGGFGVMVTAYSGFLITQAVGVPLWNTALIPILWVVSAGVAVLALLELFHLKGWIDERVSHTVTKMAVAGDTIKLAMLFTFLYVGLSAGSAGAREGAATLLYGSLAPMLWIGVIGVGALVPVAVSLYTMRFGERRSLVFAGALFALAGGLLLRASVLLAGKFDPLVL